MMTEEFDTGDGRRAWLTRDEFALLVDALDEPMRQVAARLGAESGLRSDEIVRVVPDHLYRDPEVGPMLQVPEGKTGHRETIISEGLADLVRALGHGAPDEPVVPRSTRAVRSWMQDAREQLREHDDRWRWVTPHDWRRTWAGWLANDDVDERVALRWGGWSDLETFLDHYRGEATARAQARERSKIEWL